MPTQYKYFKRVTKPAFIIYGPENGNIIYYFFSFYFRINKWIWNYFYFKTKIKTKNIRQKIRKQWDWDTMHFKGVIVIILLVCIAFTRTYAQSFYDIADVLVKLVMNDPVFVLLDEQKKMGVLREIYTFLDKYNPYIRMKQKNN